MPRRLRLTSFSTLASVTSVLSLALGSAWGQVLADDEAPDLAAGPLEGGFCERDASDKVRALDFEDLKSASSLNLPLERDDVQRWKSRLKREHPVVLERYLARAVERGPEIRQALRAEGVPEDFLYLALVESGARPDAQSHAGAVGLWQLRPVTAWLYGLTVSENVDERRNVAKSTRAAARYLSDLHDRFGSWELAAAAYNAGPTRVQRALDRADVETFWELAELGYLPHETLEYVPRFLATVAVARDAGLEPMRLSPSRLAQMDADRISPDERTSRGSRHG